MKKYFIIVTFIYSVFVITTDINIFSRTKQRTELTYALSVVALNVLDSFFQSYSVNHFILFRVALQSQPGSHSLTSLFLEVINSSQNIWQFLEGGREPENLDVSNHVLHTVRTQL